MVEFWSPELSTRAKRSPNKSRTFLGGVQLKKTGHAQRMTEIFFVDLRTEAVGFFNRSKLLEKKFITVVKSNNTTRNNKGEQMTLEEAEKDQQKYDFYVFEIRKIFGIAQPYQGLCQKPEC